VSAFCVNSAGKLAAQELDMRVFIVFAHPEPRSFNGALFHTAVDSLRSVGHEVTVSDLYAMGFDPVSSRANFTSVRDSGYYKQQLEELHATEVGGFAPEIEAEILKVEACDLMIWQFPLWWFGLPAILKGWVDRVFAMGRTYGGGRFYGSGVFSGKRALLSLTTGALGSAYVRGGFNGDIEAILRPIQRGMLRFVGFETLAPNVVFGPAHMSNDDLKTALSAYGRRMRGIEGESPVDPGEY